MRTNLNYSLMISENIKMPEYSQQQSVNNIPLISISQCDINLKEPISSIKGAGRDNHSVKKINFITDKKPNKVKYDANKVLQISSSKLPGVMHRRKHQVNQLQISNVPTKGSVILKSPSKFDKTNSMVCKNHSLISVTNGNTPIISPLASYNKYDYSNGHKKHIENNLLPFKKRKFERSEVKYAEALTSKLSKMELLPAIEQYSYNNKFVNEIRLVKRLRKILCIKENTPIMLVPEIKIEEDIKLSLFDIGFART